ncbi:NADH dehydrogenase-like [Tropilaelaps mercedesae]|uniref:NADH dehydrogenase [ubiquinone] 1 beta subcomplex subunit 4 n=1 Tax=Tropilaelaps mercedesae TaxID=418985 RepID=A0A1V9XNG6_9ACAR|nr:NADH dehydrogenase-like [Tropilaelaps mercedesae]
MSHKIPSPYAERSELTPSQVRLASERLKIRERLRQEYLAKILNPNQGQGPLFDPAMQRFQSARTGYYEYFKPSPKNALHFLLTTIFPIAGFCVLMMKDRKAFSEKCAKGEIPYEKRMFKFM